MNPYRWYLNNKDPLDFLSFIVKVILFFLILWISFFKNYTYYEDISINHYPINAAPLYKNISDDITLNGTEDANKVLYISPETTPVKLTIEKYNPSPIPTGSYKPVKSIKPVTIEPGTSYKITYFETDAIPEYQLKLETDTGKSTVSMAFNGKYQVNDRYRIKAKLKLVPFLINRFTN